VKGAVCHAAPPAGALYLLLQALQHSSSSSVQACVLRVLPSLCKSYEAAVDVVQAQTPAMLAKMLLLTSQKDVQVGTLKLSLHCAASGQGGMTCSWGGGTAQTLWRPGHADVATAAPLDLQAMAEQGLQALAQHGELSARLLAAGVPAAVVSKLQWAVAAYNTESIAQLTGIIHDMAALPACQLAFTEAGKCLHIAQLTGIIHEYPSSCLPCLPAS